MKRKAREPAQCPHCDSSFTKPDHLARHLRTHTAERPFTCDVCQKSFGRRDVLLRHTRLHKKSTETDLPVQQPLKPLDELAAEQVTSPSVVATSLTMLQGLTPAPPSITSPSGIPGWEQYPSEPSLELDSLLAPISNFEDFDLTPVFDWHLGLGVPPLFDESLFDIPRQLEEVLKSRAPSPGPFEVDSALNDFAVASAFSRIDMSHALTLWPSTQRTDRGQPFQWGPPGEDQFRMPSTGFLATSLQLYFKRMHPRHFFIHAPTFAPMHHSPICLLSMCANGAQVLGTDQAKDFSAQVHQRVMHLLRHRASNDHVDPTQATDILLCVTLLLYSGGLQVGAATSLSALSALHAESVALARQVKLFAADGPATFSVDARMLAETTDEATLQMLWHQWARTECARRASFSLLFIDGWLNAILQEQHPPLIPLSSIRHGLPCPAVVFGAQTAASWAKLYREYMATSPPPCATLVSRLYAAAPTPLTSCDAPQLKSILSLIAIHWRFRSLAVELLGEIDDASQEADYVPDLATARAVQAVATSHTFDLGEDLLYHLVSIWCAIDVRRLEAIVGRRGPATAKSTLARLVETDWIGSPATRRAVVHAGHIYVRSIAHGPRPDAKEPYTIHHALAPFHAALVLYVYSTLASALPSRIVEGGGADLVLDASLASSGPLGMVGYGEDGLSTAPAAAFVRQGGIVMVDGESLISQNAKSTVLLTTASFLEASSSWTCWPIGKMYASIIRTWLDAEMRSW